MVFAKKVPCHMNNEKNRDLLPRFVHWVGYDLGITPNQVTLGRLILFFPGWLMWFFMQEISDATGLPWQAVGAVGGILVTTSIFGDLLDGAIARATGQVSDRGKVLDPLVDKFITYSALVLFWPAITHVGLVALFILDFASTFLRGTSVHGASEFGKKKALSQNISKGFFAMAVLTGFSRLNTIGNLLIWGALILAAVSVGVRIVPARAKNPVYRLIPQVITFCNLLCGVYAMYSASMGEIHRGALLLFAAMGFDLADGAVARRLGVEGSFGKHFDSVADMVSFGLAPAWLLAATAGWSPVSIAAGAAYTAATAVRLYDYGRSKGKVPRGFFRGMPSPAAAWMAAAAVVCLPYPWSLGGVLAAGAVMCSFPVRWQHFSSVLPTLSFRELGVAIVIGLVPALHVTPLGFIAGPILVYLFSPIWRRPPSAA